MGIAERAKSLRHERRRQGCLCRRRCAGTASCSADQTPAIVSWSIPTGITAACAHPARTQAGLRGPVPAFRTAADPAGVPSCCSGPLPARQRCRRPPSAPITPRTCPAGPPALPPRRLQIRPRSGSRDRCPPARAPGPRRRCPRRLRAETWRSPPPNGFRTSSSSPHRRAGGRTARGCASASG